MSKNIKIDIKLLRQLLFASYDEIKGNSDIILRVIDIAKKGNGKVWLSTPNDDQEKKDMKEIDYLISTLLNENFDKEVEFCYE